MLMVYMLLKISAAICAWRSISAENLPTPLYTCNSLLDGRNLLLRLIEEFELCPKLCFIQTNNEPCTGAKWACMRLRRH